MSGAREPIELSHVLRAGMAVYPGLPSPRIEPIVTHEASAERYQGKAEFRLDLLTFAGNTGTYLDAPYHRFRDGADLSQMPLSSLAGLPGLVVDAGIGPARSIPAPREPHAFAGKAVLVRTGWSERWGTDAYWEPGPYLARGFVDALVEQRAALVGVDFWNIDDTEDPSRPVHTSLLRAGIPIVEHLTDLRLLPAQGFRFTAVPLRIEGGTSCPVRAFAEL